MRAALIAAAAGLLAAAPAHAAPALRRCGGALCGEIRRPLDPGKPHGRTIPIAFRLYRASQRTGGPPIVAVEGGPGYPSTGSRVEYRGIFGPLLRERDLLLVDNRGTGSSALIDCRGLQAFTGRTSGRAFARRVARCAGEIDRRYGAHATDLFATAYAADDLAAVLKALGFRPVDLYGDSYGTFFVQHFMARHPEWISSVVLDSAYSPRDLDPWYASSGEAARQALEIVAPGSVARLAQLLANPPVSARALADMVQDSASDPVVLRELDASVRAALAGDAVPLRRLAKQSYEWSHGPSTAGYFSDGLYWAVNCLDLPRLGATPVAQDAFRPFTTAQWLTISGYSQPYDGCLDWPRPVKRPPPLPDRRLPASKPILVVGGDLDSLTPFADAQVFGPKLGANVTVVELRNTVHVTSEGDTYLVEGARCARRVIRTFVRDAPRDFGCAGRIPALHTADFAATPATLVSGPDPGEAARRAATIAANALADAAIRSFYTDDRRGLRGGRFTVQGDRLTLHDVRFTPDAVVNGTGRYEGTGAVSGTLTVGATRVKVAWTQADSLATATVGDAVLSLPAP